MLGLYKEASDTCEKGRTRGEASYLEIIMIGELSCMYCESPFYTNFCLQLLTAVSRTGYNSTSLTK